MKRGRPRPRRRPARAPWRRRLAWSLLAVALALAAIEVAGAVAERFLAPPARAIPTPRPDDDPDITVFRAAQDRLRARDPDWGARIPLAEDPDLGWALHPGARFQSAGVQYRVNDRGLRGPDLPPPAPGEQRLVALGDSTVFGISVGDAQAFVEIAAGILERAWGVPVGPVNMGVPGFDSGQSLALLRRDGPAVRPAWVVVANLWSDVYRRPESYRDQDRAALASARSALRHSAAYRALWRLLTPVLTARKVGYIDARDDIGEVGTARPCRVALPDYAANLAAIADLCAQLGARVAFLILPAPMDQDAVPPPHAVQEFRATLRRVAGERQAPLLDGPALFAASDAGLALFDDHVHPSVEGHLLLGVGLADLLKDLPPRSL